MEHAQIIIDSTQEIFSSMIMMDAAPGEPFMRKHEVMKHSISGLIGLAGATKGMLAIHLSTQTALLITEAFLGMAVDEINDDVCDAIGELANMVAGNIKSALDPKGTDIKLSMPSAVYGEEYSVDCLADAQSIAVPFTVEGNSFLVELQLRQENGGH